MFPNPNQGSFVIEASGMNESEFSVYNGIGQNVYHGQFEYLNRRANFKLPLAPGFYYLVLNNDEKKLIQKFIVE